MLKQNLFSNKNPQAWHGFSVHQTIDIESLNTHTNMDRSVQVLKTSLREIGGFQQIAVKFLISRITYKVDKLGLNENQCLNDPKNIEASQHLIMSNKVRLHPETLTKLSRHADDHLQGLQEA